MKLADLDLDQDVTILVLSAAIGRSRSNKSPYQDVANQLKLPEGRVRHRTWKSVKALPTHPSLAPYAEAFEELLAKKFSMYTTG